MDEPVTLHTPTGKRCPCENIDPLDHGSSISLGNTAGGSRAFDVLEFPYIL
jgi:hypothetical protein